MEVNLRNRGNTRIVDVSGAVDLKAAPRLRQILFESVGEARRVALNLASITLIDSSGIAVMLEALRESQRLQHEFVAFGMNPAVCDVFKITHVARIFHVAGSEEQVLGAANPETSRRAEIS